MTSPVSEWSVSDVQGYLSGEDWVDPTFLRLLKFHAVDGAALLELTKDDLRYDFAIQELGRVKTILRNIAAISSTNARCLSATPIDRPTSATPYDDEVRAVLRGLRAGTPDAYYRPTSSIMKDNIPRPCSVSLSTSSDPRGARGALPQWARLDAWETPAQPPPRVISTSVALVAADTYPVAVVLPSVVGILETYSRRERLSQVAVAIRAASPEAADTAADTLWSASQTLDNVSFDRYVARCLETTLGQVEKAEGIRRMAVARALHGVWREGSQLTPLELTQTMAAVGFPVTEPVVCPQGTFEDADAFAAVYVQATVRAASPEAFDVAVFRVQRHLCRRRVTHDVTPELLRGWVTLTHRVLLMHSWSTSPWASDPFDVVEKAAAIASARLDLWHLTDNATDESARRKAVVDNVRRGGATQGRWVYISFSPEYLKYEKKNAVHLLREIGLVVSTQMAASVHSKFRLFLYVPVGNAMLLPSALLNRAHIVDTQNSKATASPAV